eukprot:jgi/Botrbrau1/7583/Bobra.0159s0032.1
MRDMSRTCYCATQRFADCPRTYNHHGNLTRNATDRVFERAVHSCRYSGLPAGGYHRSRSIVVRVTASKTDVKLSPFPADYPAAIRQAQEAVKAAIEDGQTLIEVEFPTSSLIGVQGDGEGANEMTYSLGYLRQFCRIFQNEAAQTRIFFPDQKEMIVAREGRGMDPGAGSSGIDPVFDNTKFKLDYLTRPSVFLDMGLDLNKFNPTQRTSASDQLFVIAYPHFNVNEMIAVEELWQGAAKESGRPIIVFNGELDRIRSGYYPALFYPKIGRLAKSFIPSFTSAFYIHNFKGNRPGTLFRVYPGPWQVLLRDPFDSSRTKVVHTQDSMPSLKEVALDILPRHR